MPRLSVVIATHDRAELVGDAVRSVVGQTMDDLEVVVVDDASTDDTAEAVARAAAGDRRVRYERLDAQRGPSGARNHGISVSSGIFVGFCDDDDEWLPRKAAEQIAFLTDHPELGGASCHSLVADEGRGTTRTHRRPLSYPREAMLWSNFPGSCTYVLLRREALPVDGPFDEDLPACVDWDLWLAVAEHRPIATTPSVLARYRFHGRGQLTTGPEYRRGHEVILAKHGKDMSSACRAYHLARLQTRAAHGLWDHARTAVLLLRTCPPPVLGILSRESVSARVGFLLGDPLRSLRLLADLAERTR